MTNTPQTAEETKAITSQMIHAVIKKQFPEAYWVGQLGWCGPGFDKAADLESRLRGDDAYYWFYVLAQNS